MENSAMEVRDASFASADEQPTEECPRQRCRSVRKRPRLMLSLVGGAALMMLVSLIVYLTVPQAIINQRLEKAVINIDDCILEIGPNADSHITPTVSFSVSKEVLALPLVSFTARVDVFKADMYFRMPTTNVDVKLGIFEYDKGIEFNSKEDMNIHIKGQMTITNPPALAQMVNVFMKQPNISLSASAKVNIMSHVWGWFPMPFFGIGINKALTLPAFDNFRQQNIELADLLEAHGKPNVMNVTASALVYNPSPVTMILRDSFQMQVYYNWQGNDYKLGIMYANAPMTLRPGNNTPRAVVAVLKTRANTGAIDEFMKEYIGPQSGYGPAGGHSKPLLIQMRDDGDATSTSPLMREATRGLNLQVNFKPKPIYFLHAITGDITLLNSVVPPFYKVVVHLRITNPVPGPGNIQVKRVQLTAHHLKLSGPVLYTYDHEIKPPMFDPAKYVFAGQKDATADFELNPLSEVSWGFLFSPKEIFDLLREAVNMNITLGISLALTIVIDQGFEQIVHYDNDALYGLLCFHATPSSLNCGGLPPASADRGLRLIDSLGNASRFPHLDGPQLNVAAALTV